MASDMTGKTELDAYLVTIEHRLPLPFIVLSLPFLVRSLPFLVLLLPFGAYNGSRSLLSVQAQRNGQGCVSDTVPFPLHPAGPRPGGVQRRRLLFPAGQAVRQCRCVRPRLLTAVPWPFTAVSTAVP